MNKVYVKGVNKLMRYVLISLIPVVGISVYENGLHGLWVILLAVAGSVVAELIWNKLLKQEITVMDFSAAITGILLALLLPIDIPLWIPIIGGVIAIIIIKQFFGGLGYNIVNPALASLAFLSASWSEAVNSNAGLVISNNAYIGVLIAGVFLLITKVINWKATIVYILTVVLLGSVVSGQAFVFGNDAYNSLISIIMLCAVFFINDYATYPKTQIGRYLLGLGAGSLTVLFCVYGNKANGIMYAVLIMNLCVPLIDKMLNSKGKNETAKEGV